MPEALAEPRTKGDRRRESILSAVEELLEQRSITGVSVETIASQAGIARSGLAAVYGKRLTAVGRSPAGAGRPAEVIP